jgi:AcrR family transcriptional regulator
MRKSTGSRTPSATGEPRLEARRKPAQSRSRETVARLHSAAAQIIETEGLPRLNCNRIAAVAGVSIGTLYKFFPNKQAILASVVAEWNEARERSLKDISKLDPSATLSEQIEGWFRYYVETPASHVVTTSRALQFYPELGVVNEAYKSRSVDLIVQGLRRDGCKLAPAELKRVAASIHDLGSYLLSTIIGLKDEARAAQMDWSLRIMRAAIADAIDRKPPAAGKAAATRRLSRIAG